jgi:hypothetical protein
LNPPFELGKRQPFITPPSGGIPLFGHERGDLMDRVEVIDAGLVRLDRDSEKILKKRNQLQRRNRVENPSGDQRSSIREVARIFTGEKLAQDELMNELSDFFHGSRSLPCPATGRCTSSTHLPAGSIEQGVGNTLTPNPNNPRLDPFLRFEERFRHPSLIPSKAD